MNESGRWQFMLDLQGSDAEEKEGAEVKPTERAAALAAIREGWG